MKNQLINDSQQLPKTKSVSEQPPETKTTKKINLCIVSSTILVILLVGFSSWFFWFSNSKKVQKNRLTPTLPVSKIGPTNIPEEKREGVVGNYQILGFVENTSDLVKLEFKDGKVEKRVVLKNIPDEETPGGFAYYSAHIGIAADQKSFYILTPDFTGLSFYNNKDKLIGSYAGNGRLDPQLIAVNKNKFLLTKVVSREWVDESCQGVCQRKVSYEILVGNLNGQVEETYSYIGKTWVDEINTVEHFDPTNDKLIFSTHGEPVQYVRLLDLATGEMKKIDDSLYCSGTNGKILAMVSTESDKLSVVELETGKVLLARDNRKKDIGCPVLDAKGNLRLHIQGLVYKITSDGKLEQVLDAQSLRQNFPGYGFDLLTASENQHLFRLRYNGPFEYIFMGSDGERKNMSLINWKISKPIGFLSPTE